nr:immunoglobulin heavy chain junction region [Macaca mulatta]
CAKVTFGRSLYW